MTQIVSNDYTQNYIYLDTIYLNPVWEQNIKTYQFYLPDRKKTNGSLYLLRQRLIGLAIISLVFKH